MSNVIELPEKLETVRIPAGKVELAGDLIIPEPPRGVVAFAHGSGSGRFSPRNRFVADQLRQGGLATLLIDLLTTDEEAIDQYTSHLRFDIGLLADRLVAVSDWLVMHLSTLNQPVGLFGASTGAAAALVAAAKRPTAIGAVVSRGGRPDLAGEDALGRVRAPSLFIVGSLDVQVLQLNQMAMRHVRSEKHLEIVQGASHLFEEPGTLAQVAALARHWFATHLRTGDGGMSLCP